MNKEQREDSAPNNDIRPPDTDLREIDLGIKKPTDRLAGTSIKRMYA